MQTKYRNTLTCIVPESDWEHMNDLAAQFGEGPAEAERKTFTIERLTRDETGYAWIDTVVTDTVVTAVAQHPELLPEGTLVLDSTFDPENPPAYSGGTIVGVNVELGVLLSVFQFETINEE